MKKTKSIIRTQRRVVCAANRIADIIVLGPRHFDETMWKTIQLIRIDEPEKMQQGFVDQWGNFMSRREAFVVATAAGQIIEKTGNPDSPELFSEDIY